MVRHQLESVLGQKGEWAIHLISPALQSYLSAFQVKKQICDDETDPVRQEATCCRRMEPLLTKPWPTGLNTVWTDLSDRTHEDLYCKCDYSLTHRMTAFLSFSSIFYTAPTPPPHTHFRILQLNRGSLQIALWCIMWMQKSCHSSHTARYNMTLFESCVWSGDQQCNRGNPDSRLDITSNLLLTFPFFSLSLCSLSTYLFQSQNTMFPENISLEYFTTHSLSFTLSLSLFHPPSSRSLSARYNTYLFQE